MRVDIAEKSGRWLQGIAVGLSVFFVVLFLYVSFRRIAYPFQVERIEASMMTTVWRLRHGYALYSAPSLEWASFLYAPLYFWLAAALSKVMGVGYAPLRTVSMLSTLGSLGVIYALVWSETRRRVAALMAAGLYVSLYFLVYAWFDVGRVDSLSIFLFLLAVYATRRMHPVAAAVFWLLACAAKQTYVPLAVAIFLVEWRRPWRMLLGMGSLLAMVYAGVTWMNHATDHWFSYFAFGTNSELTLIPWRLAVMSLPMDLLAAMPIAIGVIVAAMLLRPLRWKSPEGSFYAIVTVVLGGATWFVRAHIGSNQNGTIPMFAWVAVLFGVAVHRLMEGMEVEGAMPPWKHAATVALWLAVVIQLATHFYTPGMILGVLTEGPARQRFQDRIRATPGDVWVVNHSYDAMQAGKPMHAEMDSYDAVLGRHYAPAVQEFETAIARGKFSAIVLDGLPTEYRAKGAFVRPPFTVAYPLIVKYNESGWNDAGDKPRYVLLPCSALTSPQAGLIDTQHGFVDRSKCP